MSKADLPPNNEEFFSGDSKQIIFKVSGVDLTGYTVTFAMFRGGQEVLRKTTGGGVSVRADGFTVTFGPADTEDKTGSYDYEAQGVGASGEVVTLAHGKLKIAADKL